MTKQKKCNSCGAQIEVGTLCSWCTYLICYSLRTTPCPQDCSNSNCEQVKLKELAIVKTAMDAEKRASVFKRYRILYLLLSGQSCGEVAEIVGSAKGMVSKIYKNYKAEGLKGINDKPIPGRRPMLNIEQVAAFKETILNKLPYEVGFSTEFIWTADLVAKYIDREYGYKYSTSAIPGMLKRIGLTKGNRNTSK